MANDLKSFEEYSDKFNQNMRTSGRFTSTTMHLPCPWCAEPDYMVVPLVNTPQVMSMPTLCKNCGRTGKTVYYHDDLSYQQGGPPEDMGVAGRVALMGDVGNSGPGYTFEFVQTDGDDPPEWMPLKPRRVPG